MNSKKTKERLLRSLKRIHDGDSSKEAIIEFMWASASAFGQGSGLIGKDIQDCFDEVYGKDES